MPGDAARAGGFSLRRDADSRPWLFALVIVAAVVAAYANSFLAPFHFDDQRAIVNNPYVRRITSPLAALADRNLGAMRPLALCSFQWNFAAGGLNKAGYHAVNLAIHVLAALTLFGIVRRTLLRSDVPPKYGRWAAPLAAAVALLWAVHPLQTESVTYIVQRCESLAGMFYLLTLYCAIRSDGDDKAWLWQCAAVVACACGVLTKEVAVTAPVAILAYDRIFLAIGWRELFARRGLLYAGLFGTWGIMAALLTSAPDISTWGGFSYDKTTPLQYALTQTEVILHYLRLAFWPSGQCLDYAWPPVVKVGDAWVALAVIAALVAATIVALCFRPKWGFLGLWFFLVLAPTSSILPIEDTAVEHRMYLPLAAVVCGSVFVTYEVSVRTASAVGLPRAAARMVMSLGLLLVAWALAIATARRNYDWRSPGAIWASAVAQSPHNPRAHFNLAAAAWKAGDYDSAARHATETLRLDSDFAEAHNLRAGLYANEGRLDDAAEAARAAIKINPNLALAHTVLGKILAQQEQWDQAVSHLERALALNWMDVQARASLAFCLAKQQKTDAARRQIEIVLKIRPDDPQARRIWLLLNRSR